MQNNIKRIKILDSSLREGEQMRGFRFSLDEKIALIRLLKDFGIRFIEFGLTFILFSLFIKLALAPFHL